MVIFRKVEKKHLFLLVLSIVASLLKAQCPPTCSGCSINITSNSSTNYNLTTGQSFCIASGADYSGTVTLASFGTATIKNCGTFSGTLNLNNGDATIINSGTWSYGINDGGAPPSYDFTNCSGGTYSGTTLYANNADVFTNYGTINLPSGNIDANYGAITNYGTITVANTYSVITNFGTFTNYGYVNTDRFYMNFGDYYEYCKTNVRATFYLNWGIVHGPTGVSDRGRMDVAGNTNCTWCTYGNGATEKLDLCDAGSPSGGWDTKSNATIGAAVTYCTNAASSSNSYCSAALPIELSYFNANCNDQNKIALHWITRSEINNDYFTLERSTDAINFSQIGIVKGAGNNITIKNYYFTDEFSPKGQTLYYRLKQTDYDGNYSYSFIAPASCAIKGIEILIYPNPVIDKLAFDVYSDVEEDITVETFNTLGQLVSSDKQHITAGSNHFSSDISRFSNGMYVLKISGNKHFTQERFFKEALQKN